MHILQKDLQHTTQPHSTSLSHITKMTRDTCVKDAERYSRFAVSYSYIKSVIQENTKRNVLNVHLHSSTGMTCLSTVVNTSPKNINVKNVNILELY